jgi:hypothetical protein
MAESRQNDCPDCSPNVNRRDFVKGVTASAAVIGTSSLLNAQLFAGPKDDNAAETTAGKLYNSLSDEQKKVVCFEWDNKLRTKLNANWKITRPGVGDDFYTADQQKLIDTIFRNVTSADGYKRFKQQMEDDAGGFGEYAMALFGKPGTKNFEWKMTGRHHTIRADGNSTAGVAFGGPIVYGHQDQDPSTNLFHYQTKAANAVFAALDPAQRKAALLQNPPGESKVPLQGKKGTFPGIAGSELSKDQKELLETAIKTVLGPYRSKDIAEALSILKAGGGIDKLHIAFYQKGDLQSDKVWDIWRLEGPTFVSHFRGAPHVHAYINIGTKAKA